jgi:hypothetical protein
MRHLRRLAAVVMTLAAMGLATTAQPAPAHAAGADLRAGRTTSLRLHITGCDHCTVQLQHAVHGDPYVWSSKHKRIGSDHHVTFQVRTGRTHGLSFVLRAPWQGNTGAVPNIVTRYAGRTVDSLVTRKAARHGTRAEGCWAGTSMDALTLDFHVARVRAITLTGAPTYIPLAYATHTMSSWRPMTRTFKGTIANQDAFYCTKPPTTTVTLSAPGCDRCRVQVMNAARNDENFWGSRDKRVTGGLVSFVVPRPLTRGISATVVAPWEGTTDFTTLVAFRYGGRHIGDHVSFADARTRSRGSACWAGTTKSTLTIALTVRQVTVPGTTGPTAGTIAFARVTQPWLRPMMSAGKGVLGAQDTIVCAK